MTEATSTECFLKTFASLLLLYGCVMSVCFLKRDDDDADDEQHSHQTDGQTDRAVSQDDTRWTHRVIIADDCITSTRLSATLRQMQRPHIVRSVLPWVTRRVT